VLIGAMLLGAPCKAQSDGELQQLDRSVFELIRVGKNPEAALVAQQAIDKAAEEFGPTHPQLPAWPRIAMARSPSACASSMRPCSL
jgi:hypothetical protein